MLNFQYEKANIEKYFKKKIQLNKKYYLIYIKIKSNHLLFFNIIKIIEINKNLKTNKEIIIEDLYLPYLFFFIIKNYDKDRLFVLKKINSFFKLVDRFNINSFFEKKKN